MSPAKRDEGTYRIADNVPVESISPLKPDDAEAASYESDPWIRPSRRAEERYARSGNIEPVRGS